MKVKIKTIGKLRLTFHLLLCNGNRQVVNWLSHVRWYQRMYRSFFMKVTIKEEILPEQKELQKLQRCVDLEI